jgi:hypothetical protein
MSKRSDPYESCNGRKEDCPDERSHEKVRGERPQERLGGVRRHDSNRNDEGEKNAPDTLKNSDRPASEIKNR